MQTAGAPPFPLTPCVHPKPRLVEERAGAVANAEELVADGREDLFASRFEACVQCVGDLDAAVVDVCLDAATAAQKEKEAGHMHSHTRNMVNSTACEEPKRRCPLQAAR